MSYKHKYIKHGMTFKMLIPIIINMVVNLFYSHNLNARIYATFSLQIIMKDKINLNHKMIATFTYGNGAQENFGKLWETSGFALCQELSIKS